MSDEPKRRTKRRGNGEGSIFQRSDKRWAATIAAGYGANGKRIRKTVYGKTKKEVQDELAKLQHTKSTGDLSAASKVTVAQYLNRWLADVVRVKVRESTHRRYGELVRLHMVPRIGGVRLQRLSAADVQAVYSTMEQNGLSPRMRQFVHTVLRKALSNAMRWGLVNRNVCEQVDPPRVSKQTMHPMDKSQSTEFLKAAEGDRLSAMYVVAITTGMRQGELFALQWADVDLATGQLSVRYTLSDQLELAEPKTAKSRRRVELPAMAVTALWGHKAAMLAAGNAASPFVFCDRAGGPLRRQNILRRSFASIVEATKVAIAEYDEHAAKAFPPIRFHDLRHTAATLMLLANINPKIVSETLGHATVAITLDIYSHVLPSMGKEAAATMNRLFAVAT